MKLILKIAAGVVLAFVLLFIGIGVLVSISSSDAKKAIAVHNPSQLSDPNADAGDSDHPGETKAQENARGSAESYLSNTSFSRKGLIQQLKYEGYSLADATYAVDSESIDWDAQAAAKATEYLDTSSFSHSGLVQQLTFEGFTAAQAEYGVSQAGL